MPYLVSIGRVVCSPLRVTREPAGTLPRIIQPAPMTQLSPMSVPLSSTTSEAIQQLRPTVMQPAVHSRPVSYTHLTLPTKLEV